QAPLSAAFDYYSAKINLAVALTGVNAEAALLGEASPLIDLGLLTNEDLAASGVSGAGGGLMSTGDVHVKVEGAASATASVALVDLSMSWVNVGANVLVSKLTATQRAYISGVSLGGTNVSVKSTLNDGMTPAAKATLSGNKISVNLVGAKANTATAIANASNIACIEDSAIALTGVLEVNARGNTWALATVDQGANAGVATVGLIVVYAEVGGECKAYIDASDSKSIAAGSIAVDVNHIAKVEAATTRAAGGVQVSVVSGDNNMATAKTTDRTTAAIIGSGAVQATGALNVRAIGTGIALAEVQSPVGSVGGVSIATNVVIATLNTIQNAYISCGGISAGTVKVLSKYNDGALDANGGGATARLRGTATGSSLTFVGVDANKALASMNSTNHAYISGIGVLNGSLTIESAGTSLAAAGVEQKSGAGYASFGVTHVEAYANGDFAAYLDADGASINCSSLTVSTTYSAKANARTTQSAGSVDASVISGKVNIASAYVYTVAAAAVMGKKGAGAVDAAVITGDLTVTTTGTAVASAEVEHPSVTLTGINIAANILTATAQSSQTAYISNANIKAANIAVTSNYNQGATDAASGGARAVLRGTGDGVGLALVGTEVNTASATAAADSWAYISGTHIVAGTGGVSIQSVGTSLASAVVEQKSDAGLAGFGITVVKADADGSYQAYLDATGATVNAQSLSVTTTYTAKAVAETTQSTKGGVTASAAAGKVNKADAKVAISAGASVRGSIVGGSISGTVAIGGAVNAKVLGTAHALACVQEPNKTLSGIDVAANVINAELGATQSARIQNVNLTAGAVSVLSELNKGKTDGATATLSGSGTGVTLVEVNINTATAIANNTANAFVEGAAITCSSISVKVDATSHALTETKDESSIGFAGLGVTVVEAKANGTFSAYLKTSSVTAGSGGVGVYIAYTSSAGAEASQPEGGAVEISGVSIEGNKATATAGTAASAYIDRGCVSTTGALTIQIDGTATAEAQIAGASLSVSGVKIAVNLVKASVTAALSAYISKADITAGSVTVKSNLNLADEKGAKAFVGSNGTGSNMSITLLGGGLSKAEASVTATVQSYVSGANMIVGALSVQTEAKSYACADIVAPSTTVSLFNVSVIETTANAAGTYTAKVDSTDQGANQSIKASSLNILVAYWATSFAATGPAGGLQASIASGSKNKATATTGLTATATLRGSGSVEITGNATVEVVGRAKSEALGRSHGISISGVKVSVNEIEAKLNATQSADASNAGTMSIGGKLTVKSEFKRDEGYGGTTATVGGAAGGVNISLLNATVNTARASATAVVSASISGGLIQAGSVDIDALADMRAIARALTAYDVSFATVGNLDAAALALGTVKAYVQNATLKVAGSVSVDASSKAYATASSQQAGGIGVGNNTSAKARAFVGTPSSTGLSEDEMSGLTVTWNLPQTSTAYVDGATVEAGGSISITAYNQGEAQASIKKNTSVSVGSINESRIPTASNYSTTAKVYGDSSLSAGGSISIKAQDDTYSRSDANGKSIGIAVNANYMYGRNHQTVNTSVEIEEAILKAAQAIDILATSKAYMSAKTEATDGGFFSGTQLQAKNTLIRNTTVDIEDGAHIEADRGNVTIKAVSGTEDHIITRAKIKSGGVVNLAKAKVTTDLDLNTQVNIKSGSKIVATFNTVHISADGSLWYLDSDADVDASGMGTAPRAETFTDVSISPEVNITGATDNLVSIIANIVELRTFTSCICVSDRTFSKGKAIGANVDGNVDLDVEVDSIILIRNAVIKGYGKINIKSISSPTGDSINVYGYSKIVLAAAGEGTARVDMDYDNDTEVDIDTGVVMYGYDVYIEAVKPTAVATYGRETDGFIVKNKRGTQNIRSGSVCSIHSSAKFYLGGAAGGIVIEVSKVGGATVVRQIGLQKNRQHWTVTAAGVQFGAISNNVAGRLVAMTNDNQFTVYGQEQVSSVTIVNNTDLNITLGAITLDNSGFVRPVVTLNRGVYYTKTMLTTSGGAPKILVESRGSGSVAVNALISNAGGTVSFKWTGEGSGALTCTGTLATLGGLEGIAPIWARSLTVSNAASIGTEGQPLLAFLFGTLIAGGAADLTADGDIHVVLTPVELKTVDTMPAQSALDKSPVNTTLSIGSVFAGGNVDIELGDAIRLYQVAGTSIVSICPPGMLTYMTDVLVGLTQNVVLDNLGALSRYMIEDDPFTGMRTYYLPNGTMLYTAADGSVLRVVEGGVDVPVGDYQFTVVDGTVTKVQLAQGVTLNMSDGKLTIAAGYTFSTLLSAIDGAWIINNLGKGANKFTFVYGYGDDGAALESTLDFWKTAGTLSYYFLASDKLSAEKIRTPGQITYMLTYDTASHVLSAYQIVQDSQETVQQNPVDDKYTVPFFGIDNLYLVYDPDEDTLEYGIKAGATMLTKPLAYETYGGVYILPQGMELDYLGTTGVLDRDYFFILEELVDAPHNALLACAVARPASLTVGKTGSNSYYHVGFDTGSVRNIAFTGQVSGAPLRKVALPSNNIKAGDGYRIAPGVYVHEDGTVVAFRVVRNINEDSLNFGEYQVHMNGATHKALFTAAYGVVNGKIRYTSDRLFMENLVNASGASSFAPKITFKYSDTGAGGAQNVMLENLTGEELGGIAVDVQGRYYRKEESGWVLISSGLIYTWTDEGETRVIDKVTGETAPCDVTTTLVSGYLTIEITVLADGSGRIVDIVYTLSDGTRVSMDGTVTVLDSKIGDQASVEVEETDYKIGYIRGNNVRIAMGDPQGSMLDGRFLPVGFNIEALNNLEFVAHSSGSIGASPSPMSVLVLGKILLKDYEDETDNTIITDTYLQVLVGDIAFDEDIHILGAVLEVNAVTGSVTFKGIEVEGLSDDDKAGLTIRAGVDIVGEWIDVVLGEVLLAANRDVRVIAAEGMGAAKPAIKGEDGSAARIEAGGSVALSNVVLDDCPLTVVATAGGIALGNLTAAADSEISLTASGSITALNMEFDDSPFTATANGGSIALGNLTAAAGSDVSLTAVGSITAGDVALEESPFTATAGKDPETGVGIALNNVSALEGSDVSLDAVGSITALDVELGESAFTAITRSSGGSIKLGDVTAEDSERIDLEAAGIEAGDVSLNDSPFAANALGGGIALGSVTAVDSDIELKANEGIQAGDISL
ncbi:MAG: hypothetical protein GX592_04025, partial [Clostridiales bacterium]|nr:hypothetical protein [Clostridiales bacterium]